MAEQIPYGVATSLVNRLASAAFREFGRIYGVMDELERLKNTVESIRAVLLDADEKQEQSYAVQNWVRRLKDVLLPADDLIEEFVIEDIRHKRDEANQNKVAKVLHSLSPSRVAFRRKMAHEIEKIQKKFSDVVKDMSGLNLNQNVVVVEQSNNVKRETSSFVLESDIIGRENDKKKIISLLRQSHENQNVSVVAIVGIGGLGKTTLAQLVYNDGKVQNFFEMSMWIHVSDNFDVKTILKNILKSLTDKTIGDSLEDLQKMLRDILTNKRYLLLLDDIWNESFEKWDQLRAFLMCGAQGSKILVTTRSKIVAQTMSVSEPYVLNGLNLEESWSLLKKIAFQNDTIGGNRAFESIGMEIAKKCKGVPLAIRSLGGILQNKREEREWIDVLQGEFWKLCEDKDSIMPVLKLSYQNLLPQQRQCFAYCSLYPKDWVIEKDELIQMWMAQGYLDCSVEGQCMKDVGNQFVNIFLMKSFFQEAKMNREGGINGFKMHDLMHDLATQVAGNDCCYLDKRKKRCPERLVHVSLAFDDFFLLESLDTTGLRTLIILSSFEIKNLEIILKFKSLRVLVLRSPYFRKLRGSIEQLKHLRYLSLLNFRRLKSLPKSISNIVYLQAIRLSLNEEVVFSTKVVSKLINLRHLEINGCTFRDRTLGGFEEMSIQQKEGVIFSKWLSPLTNIIEIHLDNCRDVRYLPPMERLPFLKSLWLCLIHELEYIYYEEPILHESFFPSLENLIFVQCKDLKGWRRMGDVFNDSNCSHDLLLPTFPFLSKLKISGCRMLTCMPTFPNIKRLSLNEFNVKILQATLNIAESQYRIGFPPLSMLKSLEIYGTGLELKKVPHDWLQNMTSLKDLEFNYLSNQHFQVIEKWFKDKLNCFPSLRKITFFGCQDLKALPDWICNFSSLQHIKIAYYTKMTLVPEGLSGLTNLRTLEIIKSPLLSKECKTETSPTWSKIAHIPNIIISDYWH